MRHFLKLFLLAAALLVVSFYAGGTFALGETTNSSEATGDVPAVDAPPAGTDGGTTTGYQEKDIRMNRLDNLLFNSQNSLLIAGCNKGQGGCIRFWAIEDGKLKHSEELGNEIWAFLVSLSHDGKFLAAALSSNERGCYSIEKKKWMWKTNWGREGMGEVLLFTPDDQRIVANGSENILYYDAKTGKILKTQKEPLNNYPPRGGTLEQIVISSDAKYIVIWQMTPRALAGHGILGRLFANKKIVIWDLEKVEEVASLRKDREICSAVFTPAEEHVIFGTEDGHIQAWDFSAQKIVRDWKVYNSAASENPTAVDAISISPAGKYLATLASSKWKGYSIKIWEYSTNKLVHEFSGVAAQSSVRGCWLYPMAFSPDGKYFAFEQNGKLCLYDTQMWVEKWCVDS